MSVSTPNAPDAPRYADDLAEEIEDLEHHASLPADDDGARFLDREGSWLEYSARLLDLAEDEATQAPDEARARFAKALKRYLNLRDLDIDWETANSAPLEALVNSLAMGLPFEPAEKQALLEAPDLEGRFAALTTLLEIDALEDGDDEGHSLQ